MIDETTIVNQANSRTWTFFGHWSDSSDRARLILTAVVEGEVYDDREDDGTWEGGLFCASASGPTPAEAEAALRAEYESPHQA